MLLGAILLLTGFFVAPLIAPSSAAHPLEIPPLPARVLTFCALFAVGAVYFGWSWTEGRRTLPMKTWKLLLVRADGTALDRRTALIRYFAAWIGVALALVASAALKPTGLAVTALALLPLNFLWGFVDPDRLFLHDRLAGTRIVGDTSSASTS